MTIELYWVELVYLCPRSSQRPLMLLHNEKCRFSTPKVQSEDEEVALEISGGNADLESVRRGGFGWH